MGSIGDCFDNSVAESPFGNLQLELLDQREPLAVFSLALNHTSGQPTKRGLPAVN